MSDEELTDLEAWFVARQLAIIVSLVSVGVAAMIWFGIVEVAPDKRDVALAMAIVVAGACAVAAVFFAIGLRRERIRIAQTQQLWNGRDHDKWAR
ncbi:hypothetical protein [Nocardia brasiliensis]|uniref:hypothetical protein n=1 Tax=Nocardia brasiliensis TaxID=37326 RepID=UPI002454E311|nr:hypothetical protein [Nocardia brasiliensis]